MKPSYWIWPCNCVARSLDKGHKRLEMVVVCRHHSWRQPGAKLTLPYPIEKTGAVPQPKAWTPPPGGRYRA